MPKIRPIKPESEEARFGGWGDSRSKAGIWFYERQEFKNNQKKIIEELKNQVGYLDIENAIMVVDPEIEGVVIVAPNPSLPGMMILADSSSREKSNELEKKLQNVVNEIMAKLKIKGVKQDD